jgi:hypothetical protein
MAKRILLNRLIFIIPALIFFFALQTLAVDTDENYNFPYP